MMDRNHWNLTTEQFDLIMHLLSTTDMPMTYIAIRVGCSRYPVHQVNKRYDIRPTQIHRRPESSEGLLNVG
jgi:hypothetical protein